MTPPTRTADGLCDPRPVPARRRTPAKHSPLTECAVAQAAISLANACADDHGVRDHTAHVGFYLIDRGVRQLELAVQYRRPLSLRVRRLIGRFPLFQYLAAILVMTLAFGAALIALMAGRPVRLASRTDGGPGTDRRKPARLGARELAVDLAGHAATPAAHGFLPGLAEYPARRRTFATQYGTKRR